MEKHISFLQTCCRLCGKQVNGKVDVAIKQSFKQELWLRFQVNVDVDKEEIHPTVICPACKGLLYRVRGAADPSSISTTNQPYLWREHNDQDCPCSRRKRKARRPLKTKPKHQINEKRDGSETESAEESESEHEKNSCQQFSTLMQNIKLMDRELALVCAENLSRQFDLIFLDRKNMDAAVSNLTVADRMLITSTIFSSEKDNGKSDVASCSQTYKSVPALLQVTPLGMTPQLFASSNH